MEGHVVHVHEDAHELCWTAHGAAEVITPDGGFRADGDWAIWLPAGTPHDVRPLTEDAVVLPSFFDAGTHADWFGAPMPVERDRALDRLARIAGQPITHGTASARAVTALHTAIGCADESVRPVRLPREDPARSVALAILREPHRREGVQDWAARMHVSSRTLQRSFAAQTGVPLRRWRTRARVRVGAAMLREGTTVRAAAEAVGFASVSAFSAACLEETGLRPGQLKAGVGDAE